MKISTRQKITLYFSLFAGILVLLGTFSTLLIIKYSIDDNSYATLEEQLQKFSQSAKDEQAENIDKSFQKKVETKEKTYYNISNRTYNENKLDESTIDVISTDNLDASKEVYSRLIKSNGDVEFTSDLFETYQVSIENLGRNEYNYGSICIYSYTVKTADNEIIQVARYCPLSQEDTNRIVFYIFTGSVLVIVCTYFFGLILATILLRPLEKEVNVHKLFVQDARHELLTPLSVAVSSVDAVIVSKKYKSGLADLKLELKNAINVINLLVKKYINKDGLGLKEQVDIRKVISAAFNKLDSVVKEKKLIWTIAGEGSVHCDKDVLNIIIRNLIDNAVNYSIDSGQIVITITKNRLSIANQYDSSSLNNPGNIFKRGVKGTTSKGKGVGLSLTKELVEMLGWQIGVNYEDDLFEVWIGYEDVLRGKY